MAASSSERHPAGEAAGAAAAIPAVRRVTVTSGLSGCSAFGPRDLACELSVGELRREVRPLHFSRHMRLLLGTAELQDSQTLGTLPGGVAPLELSAVLQMPPQYHAQQDADLDDDADTLILGPDTFRVISLLNRGPISVVHKALHVRSRGDHGPFVAIRKVDFREIGEMGVYGQVLREVSNLQSLDHPNLIRLLSFHLVDARLYQVFEYIETDMRRFLRLHGPLQQAALFRDAARQCLKGLDYCHSRNIVHCDINPRSILVAANFTAFQLKLGRFGLSRRCEGGVCERTSEIVTLWYRAPELLLGARRYNTAVDIWSLGCTLQEMATGRALFPGDSEIGTLFHIFQQLGTPHDQVWPGVTQLPDYKAAFPRWDARNLPEAPCLGNAGGDLLRQCLTYSPAHRPATRRLLAHELFTADG